MTGSAVFGLPTTQGIQFPVDFHSPTFLLPFWTLPIYVATREKLVALFVQRTCTDTYLHR